MDLWRLNIVDGPVPITVFVLAAIFLVVIVVRRWRLGSLIWAVSAGIAGAVAGYAAYRIVNVTETFGLPLPQFVWHWLALTLAACGVALGGLVGARLWRRIVTPFAVLAFLVAGTIGINMSFGVTPTLGSLLGVPVSTIKLPAAAEEENPRPAQPLHATWKAPAGMPAVGSRGSYTIPGEKSGFNARPAGIYLPPAALVKDSPALPVMVLMMGHPGAPDPAVIGDVLDKFAAQHNGLAPIVVVADQLGISGNDTACADSKAYGKARTYITVDVVEWIKKHLNVIDDPAYWVVAGYSNGGGCAITFGATHPQLWKNILDVSGEIFPGSEKAAKTKKIIYHDNDAAFEAAKPLNVIAAAPPGTYKGMTAIFTAGSKDHTYMKTSDISAEAVRKAGMNAVRYDVPGANHTGDALVGGLAEGIKVLAPILGLSAK